MRVNLVIKGVTSPYTASGYEAELSLLYNVVLYKSNDQMINHSLDLNNTKEGLS